jgi:hypothetical protein
VILSTKCIFAGISTLCPYFEWSLIFIPQCTIDFNFNFQSFCEKETMMRTIKSMFLIKKNDEQIVIDFIVMLLMTINPNHQCREIDIFVHQNFWLKLKDFLNIDVEDVKIRSFRSFGWLKMGKRMKMAGLWVKWMPFVSFWDW